MLSFTGRENLSWLQVSKLGSTFKNCGFRSEVVRQEKGLIWYIKYPIIGSDDFVTVATTRPETMFGDIAIAVNPKDERYKDIIGKKVEPPFVKRKIPIIGDTMWIKSSERVALRLLLGMTLMTMLW